MTLLTQYKISILYDHYKLVNVTFNKDVIKATNLIPNEVCLKSRKNIYPCILNSASMIDARVIVQANKNFFDQINKGNKLISLRLAFKCSDRHVPLTFFINSGLVVRYDNIKDQEDFIAIGIFFNKEKIPFSYKKKITDYINKQKK